MQSQGLARARPLVGRRLKNKADGISRPEASQWIKRVVSTTFPHLKPEEIEGCFKDGSSAELIREFISGDLETLSFLEHEGRLIARHSLAQTPKQLALYMVIVRYPFSQFVLFACYRDLMALYLC